MKINWGIRLQHKPFLVSMFALLLLLAQQVATLFGYEIPINVSEQIISISNTVLSVLVLMGVVVDPTTKGTSDSERALNYRRPR